MNLLVMADLEMLVLDKTQFEAYDNDFFDRFLTVAKTYDKWVRDGQAKWLFSYDLLDLLQASFPWNAKSPKLYAFRISFFTWIQRALADKIIEVVSSHDLMTLELLPNIHATYVSRDYPVLEYEWRNVLARHVDRLPNQTLIFSSEPKPNQITLIDTSNNTSETFLLVKHKQDWLAVLKQYDPWLRHNLPKSGAHPYTPPKSYRSGSDFPSEFYAPRNARGFKDKSGRLWVPDEEGLFRN